MARQKKRIAEGGEWGGIRNEGSDSGEDEESEDDDPAGEASASSSDGSDAEKASAKLPTQSRKRARNGKLLNDLKDDNMQHQAKTQK